MIKKNWILIFVPFAAVILSACSAVSARSLNASVAETEPVEQTTKDTLITEQEGEKDTSSQIGNDQEIESLGDFENDQDMEPTSTDLPPTATEIPPTATSIPEPAETSPPEEHSEPACGNPFEGLNIRFSPTGWKTDFCTHSVPLGEFLGGGPRRDGIPPIDSPRFVTISSADAWLGDREPVIALEVNGDSRAYPLQILIWHEIVNDTMGGEPVVVTFCPLCNTALVFKRPEINGELLTFGTSGNLRNSDLVMWDRQTESWWQQFTGEAIVGELTGTRLDFLATPILSWADYKEIFPGSQVLSKDTGFNRDYGLNPYAGYDNVNQFPFLFDGQVDDRLLPMTRVLGVEKDGNAVAFVYDRLIEDRVVHDTLGENKIVAFWRAGTASAVDTTFIPDGRDVGSTGVFLTSVDDQALTFTATGDGTFKDVETGSTWDILGEAIDGPLMGKTLSALPHHDTFWFAWAAFVPDGALTE
jgi:hypothetical protein